MHCEKNCGVVTLKTGRGHVNGGLNANQKCCLNGDEKSYAAANAGRHQGCGLTQN